MKKRIINAIFINQNHFREFDIIGIIFILLSQISEKLLILGIIGLIFILKNHLGFIIEDAK